MHLARTTHPFSLAAVAVLAAEILEWLASEATAAAVTDTILGIITRLKKVQTSMAAAVAAAAPVLLEELVAKAS